MVYDETAQRAAQKRGEQVLPNGKEPDFATLSDEELCAFAKKGDAQAVDLLIGRYRGLIDRRSRRMQGCGLEADDLRQEGLLGLLGAIRGFDAGQQRAFGAYAGRCILNRMLNALKALQTNKQLPLFDYLSLEEAGPQLPLADGGEDPQEVLIRREERQVRMQYISGLLSEFERQALGGYLSGLSYEEIAFALCTTTKAVDNALARVRRKLKSASG